nr:hypothetical protein OH820_16245 [Streptomyces sp. NBC_00857]
MTQHHPLALTPQEEWLASANVDPESAYRDWRDGVPAVLGTGSVFDAIKMPDRLVHAAIGSTEQSIVRDVLAELGGPVIWAPACWYYALVPAGTAASWRSPHSSALGRGWYLAAPRLDRNGPSGVHWAVPVGQPGKLCTPESVAELLRTGLRGSVTP